VPSAILTSRSRRNWPLQPGDWGDVIGRSRELAAEAARAPALIDAAWLADATSWVAAIAPVWESLTEETPQFRSWMPMVEEPDLQGWLICWPAGAARKLHDHDGAPGAFRAFGPRFIHAVLNAHPQLVTSLHFYGRARTQLQTARESEGQ
jgi:hypothetical protein